MQNLLVFSDDWGRHPSSCQYLTREWLRRSCGGDANVIWVNTIGTRPPRLDWLTLRRGLEKVGSWIRPVSDSADAVFPAGLRVVNPRMWPWVASPAARRINRRLLARQLAPLLDREGGWTAVTTIPIAAVVLDALPVDRWVYYCVDDFSVWPGLDGQTMLDLERAVIERADEIICASDSLASRIDRLGRTSKVINHGVDFDFWSNTQGLSPLPNSIQQAAGSRAVFWGVVDRRLDTDWLRRLAASREIGSIILVGPHQNPDPALLNLPKVVATGPLPMEILPAVAASADVLVMPYRDEAVTRAMQPLKLKEYLATGCPVVVRSLPATDPWSDCCDVMKSADDFVAVTAARGCGPIPDLQSSARQRLVHESWQAKADAFWPLVFLNS
ncbi:glycosyltransferase [Planctomycetaceae bacterium SH139]